MQDYLNIFIDEEYPKFLDKYLKTKTLNRLKFITQFCGCDYTNLYGPLFLYTRFDHSLVVAHMTWHFTHDKASTIAALLHDVGTPCFAHSIDYVFGDYLNQESSEKKITDVLVSDDEILKFLEEDGVLLSDLDDLSKYPILENKSPKLCCDRLDGVLHTCYIWLHTHKLSEIKRIYDNLEVFTNEDSNPEIGFKDLVVALNFVDMVLVYAKELQGNTDKYVMKFVSEMVKMANEKGLITLDDLYNKKESEIISVFEDNFACWKKFNEASKLIKTNDKTDNFYISFATKKRNVIPLVKFDESYKRINEVSDIAKDKYEEFFNYRDTTYAYVEEIKELTF